MSTYIKQFLEVLQTLIYFNNSNSVLEGDYTTLQIPKPEAQKSEKTPMWLRTSTGYVWIPDCLHDWENMESVIFISHNMNCSLADIISR